MQGARDQPLKGRDFQGLTSACDQQARHDWKRMRLWWFPDFQTIRRTSGCRRLSNSSSTREKPLTADEIVGSFNSGM